MVATATAALIDAALAEDIGSGDRTTELTVPAGTRANAVLIARTDAVLAGAWVFEEVLRKLDPAAQFSWSSRDGESVKAAQAVATVVGDARALLTGERVALNFLQRLSGIATLTRAFVAALPEGSVVRLADTRKTTPGMRELERHAVLCGGGTNHRFDLGAAILIKDNHVTLAGGVQTAIERAREAGMSVEVEVRTTKELEEALAAGVEAILLDNMDPAALAKAVERIRAEAPRTLIEASGGVTLDNVAAIARTGVDRISVGALTHSAPAANFAFKIRT